MQYKNSLRNKIKLLRKRPLYRLKILLHYLFKREERDPVFIVTTRRSGSNLLLSFLGSVPEISFLSEILNPGMYYGVRSHWISRRSVLRHMIHSINHCRHRICGAKLLKIRLEAHRLDLETLKKIFPTAKFILLYRKALFEQFVSLKIAEKTDVWLWRDAYPAPQPPPVRISSVEFEAWSKSTRAFYHNLTQKAWLRECSVTIDYESLSADPQKVFDEILFPFLGVPSSAVSSSLKKQNTKPLHEVVENFDELKNLNGIDQEYPTQAPYPIPSAEFW